MKKTFIAGSATIILAATPVFGVFATNPSDVVDTLTITVAEVCELTRTSGGGSYTATMTASDYEEQFGTSTIKALCNSGSGYDVTGVFNALSGSVSGSIPYQASAPVAGTNGYTAVKGAYSSTDYLTSGTTGNLISTNGPDTASGTSAQVSYKVATAANIAAGTYTGSAVYTLVKK